jgi:hypothetical protein
MVVASNLFLTFTHYLQSVKRLAFRTVVKICSVRVEPKLKISTRLTVEIFKNLICERSTNINVPFINYWSRNRDFERCPYIITSVIIMALTQQLKVIVLQSD